MLFPPRLETPPQAGFPHSHSSGGKSFSPKKEGHFREDRVSLIILNEHIGTVSWLRPVTKLGQTSTNFAVK